MSWGEEWHAWAMEALGLWMFISKFIKLMGHYIRYPVDVLLLPVSILFGYFHGIIKIYAVLTLNVVSFNFLLFFSFFCLFLGFWANADHNHYCSALNSLGCQTHMIQASWSSTPPILKVLCFRGCIDPGLTTLANTAVWCDGDDKGGRQRAVV